MRGRWSEHNSTTQAAFYGLSLRLITQLHIIQDVREGNNYITLLSSSLSVHQVGLYRQ